MESPEKALDAGKHERTAIARPAEAQPVFGLHASFEAAWRPAHGEAQGFRLRTTNTARSRAVANNPDVSARSRFEGKRLPRTALRKGQKRRGLETCKGGSASGEADRASQRPLCPRSRRTKGCEKEGPPSLPAPSSLKLRSAGKAGRFCRSRENDGRQRLALKRQPPCGGRGCGCRASWPCRRDCR